LAWAVHGEYPGPWALLGGTLIMAATGVKSWADARRDRAGPGEPPSRRAAEPSSHRAAEP
ncbi:MAG: hypothetical protein SF070_06705, partial [Gemmatimonadota bacterium]|nr:hypothetical protein [Gemmatimonadota bacterium]